MGPPGGMWNGTMISSRFDGFGDVCRGVGSVVWGIVVTGELKYANECALVL